MLDAAKKCGIRTLCATPHYRAAWKDRESMRKVFADLVPEAKKRGIQLVLGAELYTGSFDRDKLSWYRSELAYAESSCILFEMKNVSLLAEEEEKIFLLQRAGMDVLIAHPERYMEVQTKHHVAERYLQIGCKLLISADALCRPLWNRRRAVAEWLIKNKLCAAICSDAHTLQDYIDYQELLAKRSELRSLTKSVSFE